MGLAEAGVGVGRRKRVLDGGKGMVDVGREGVDGVMGLVKGGK